MASRKKYKNQHFRSRLWQRFKLKIPNSQITKLSKDIDKYIKIDDELYIVPIENELVPVVYDKKYRILVTCYNPENMRRDRKDTFYFVRGIMAQG